MLTIKNKTMYYNLIPITEIISDTKVIGSFLVKQLSCI